MILGPKKTVLFLDIHLLNISMMGLPGKNFCKWKSTLSTNDYGFLFWKNYLARFDLAMAQNWISVALNFSWKFPKMTTGTFSEENWFEKICSSYGQKHNLRCPTYFSRFQKWIHWGSKSDFMASNWLDIWSAMSRWLHGYSPTLWWVNLKQVFRLLEGGGLMPPSF